MASSPPDFPFLVDDLLSFDDDLPSPPSPPPPPPSFPPSSASPPTSPLPAAPSHAGLCVPPDELVDELEWLSSFNEDSSYSGDTRLASLVSSGSIGGGKAMEELPLICADKTIESFYITSPVSVLEQINTNSYVFTHFDRPKRSRRARIGGRIWSLDILKPAPMASKNRDAFEASFAFMSNGESLNSSFLQHEDEIIEAPPSKKLRRASSSMEDSVMIRRCSHCLVQKTPQWRAGPLGPKTLCNACGVRYKSGRLLPEYRPASSPTFISEVHSNSHRRILEMRRAREIEVHGELHDDAMQESVEDFVSHLVHDKVHSNTIEAHDDEPQNNDTTMEARSSEVQTTTMRAHCELQNDSIELHDGGNDDDDENDIMSKNNVLLDESTPDLSIHARKAIMVTQTEGRTCDSGYVKSREPDRRSEELRF